MSISPRGSLWNRWDLHFHTPSSYDYVDRSVTNEQIVDRLVDTGLRVVAITDHHRMDVPRIRELQRLGAGRLTILPGIELRSDQGGKPIHYISIFPEDAELDHVWTRLQGTLHLTEQDVREKGDECIYVPIEDGAKLTRELGGVVSIHAGEKSNSIEGIRNEQQFQQRIKYDITKAFVDLLEIGQLKDIAVYRDVVFRKTGLEKPLIVCSDNHDVKNYTTSAALWFRADPTFRGLQMVLREPTDRVFIGDRPPDFARVEQNRTKYIRGITFAKKTGASTTERWFDGTVEFNHGLVAIVGNKGTGKSAIADVLGLLGSSKNAEHFSFLSKERFRHPTSGLAKCFEATINWESGETITKCLDEAPHAEELERIKYLPQDHVEKVCNELAGLGDEGFERELKSVIFSHVPEAQRLGFTTLDDLVRFQTGEKQKRIDSLLKQLRELSRTRASLEAQADPAGKSGLEQKLAQKQAELVAHDSLKPQPISNPAEDPAGSAPNMVLISDLGAAEEKKANLALLIASATTELSRAERRHAVAKRLIEKLYNFEKDVEVFRQSLNEDVAELRLDVSTLVTVAVERAPVRLIRDQALAAIQTTTAKLDDQDPPGLKQQMTTLKAQIEALQAQLDAPNRAYQAYLKAIEGWTSKRKGIEGTDQDPDSINGLKAALKATDALPTQIEAIGEQQRILAMNIYSEKAAQADVYRVLYGSVQKFIDSHEIAKGKLQLDFRAELACQDLPNRFLSLLSLSKVGSFKGIDEGRARHRIAH